MASSPIISWPIKGGKVEAVPYFLFLGSKITEDGDCSHEIKSHLLLGRKAIPNLDSILKSRDITLPTKVHIVKGMYGLPSSHIWMWKLDRKEGRTLKNWCFRTVVLEKTLERSLESKETQPVNPKWNHSWILIGRGDAETEARILSPDAKRQLIRKDPDVGKTGQEKWVTEN